MADENHFQELIQRVRAGDQAAAQELVTRYESKIRRVVRVKLDTRLQRHFDSMDICQSVLASFFVRAALGQYEIKTPEEVMAKIEAVTAEDVQELAQELFQPERLSLALIGPYSNPAPFMRLLEAL